MIWNHDNGMTLPIVYNDLEIEYKAGAKGAGQMFRPQLAPKDGRS